MLYPVKQPVFALFPLEEVWEKSRIQWEWLQSIITDQIKSLFFILSPNLWKCDINHLSNFDSIATITSLHFSYINYWFSISRKKIMLCLNFSTWMPIIKNLYQTWLIHVIFNHFYRWRVRCIRKYKDFCQWVSFYTFIFIFPALLRYN